MNRFVGAGVADLPRYWPRSPGGSRVGARFAADLAMRWQRAALRRRITVLRVAIAAQLPGE